MAKRAHQRRVVHQEALNIKLMRYLRAAVYALKEGKGPEMNRGLIWEASKVLKAEDPRPEGT